jgi:hypothetical protein
MHNLRVLRKIYGPKVTGGSGKLYMEQFHNLYSMAGDEVADEIGGACSTHERIEMHT